MAQIQLTDFNFYDFGLMELTDEELVEINGGILNRALSRVPKTFGSSVGGISGGLPALPGVIPGFGIPGAPGRR